MDPRPDLKSDSILWKKLLSLAEGETRAVLHGFRCCGTLIVCKNGRYILRPLFHKSRGWESKEDYEKMREKYLLPRSSEIASLLSRLSDRKAAG